MIMRLRWVLILISLLCGTPAVPSWAAAAKGSFDEKAVTEFYRVRPCASLSGFPPVAVTMLIPV